MIYQYLGLLLDDMADKLNKKLHNCYCILL